MPKLSSILLLLLVLALAACSGGGGGSDGGSEPVDDTPDDNSSEVTLQAIAGLDQSVNEGEEVVLEGGSAVSDANLSLSYSWEQVGGSAVTLSGSDGQVASFSPTVDADSELSFRLLVQTETGLEATDDLVVSVNNAPTAVSESASSVVEGFGVSLNGWQSLDSDGGSIVAYEWTQLGGASVELSYEDEATVSFTAPLVSGNDNLSFELAVTDNDGAIGRATVVVEVLDDTESPSISGVALAAGNYGIGASITLTLTAANSESGLTLKDGSSFNGQELADFAAVPGQEGNYTAIYTIADGDPSQDAGASVSANIALVDRSGNESAALVEISLDGVSIDTLPPALNSFSVSAGDYGIGDDVEITIIAADAESDLSLRAGSSFNGQELADFAAVDGEAGYYSAIYKVGSGNPDLAPTAKVGMSLVVLDAAGNESPEYVTATLSSSTSIDANAPVVASIGVASGAYGIGDEVRITITAADDETDLTLSPNANSFNGRTLSQFAHIYSGIYSAIYTIIEGDSDVADDASANISIALVDAYGNVGAAVTSALLSNSSIDATRPELSALSISDGVYGIGSDMVIFLSAAADEVGLELLNSTFNGQSLTNFSDLQNGLYALTYTVAAGDTDQADGADVAADIRFADLVGNTSLGISAISLSGESIDANAPIIESISVAAGDHGIGDAVEIVINTSEADLALAAGSTFNGQELTGFSAIDGQAGGYVATYTVAEGDSNGSDAGWVDSNIALVDAASNLGEALESVSLGAATIDAHRPEIADIDVATGEFGVGAAVAITLTASNAETGLVLVDGSSFNRVLLSGFGDNGDGTYNVTYTVSEGEADIADGGTVLSDIALADAAGNVGASIESLTLAGTSIDANSPSIALVSVAAGSYGVGALVPVTITASNNEPGLTLSSSTFNGRSLTDIIDKLDGNYSASYMVEEGDADVADGGSVSMDLAFTDAHGNVGAAKEALSLSGASIDANSPSIDSVSAATGTFIIGDDVLITITAGGSENGLALKSGSSFNGQQLSSFSATDQDGVYTATYTVADADASLAAGATASLNIALLDAAGNDSPAATEVVLGDTTIDTTVPSIYQVSVSENNVVNSSDDLTEVSVTGSTSNVEDGQPLTLDIGGITAEVSVSADDDDNGGFSAAVDLSSLGDGTHPITIDVADSSGNEAHFTGEFIKDIEPPTIDSVVVSGDDVINSSDTLSAISVSVITTGVEDDQSVSLNIGGVMLELAITSNGFDGSVDLSGLEDGTDIAVSGDVSDAAGNAAATFAGSVVKDVVAPEILTVLVADDGVINAAEASAATISGTIFGAEVGQQVSIDIGGILAAASLDSSGAFSVVVDLSGLSDGSGISLSADVADIAGNAAGTFTGSVVKDVVAPEILTVLVAGDGVINAAEVSAATISGTTSGAEANQQVSLNVGGISATALVDDSGNFSVVADLSGLSDGAGISLSADVADSAGNAAPQFAGSVIVDTTIPSISGVVVSGDDLVNASENASAVAVSGSTTDAEEGREVSLAIGGVSATALVAADGSFAVDVDLSALSTDGAYQVTADVADSAGNAAPQFVGSVIVDTTIPSIDSVVLSSDDTINASDTLSAVAVSVSTTGVEDGQVVSLDIGGVTVEVSITSNGYDGTVDLSALGDGTEIVVSANVSDVAGNAAESFTKDSFVLKDTLAPSIDSVVVSGDDKVNATEINSLVAVSGTTTDAEEGREISLNIGGEMATAQVAADGSFTTDVDLSNLSTDGTYTLSADVSDAAGNAADQFSGSVIVDTVKPSIDSVVVSGDDRVNASEIASAVSVLGSTTDAEEGREISLNIGGKTATALVAADGSFTADIDLSGISTDGTYTLSADVSDAAGNAADQFSGSVIVDTVKPSIDSVVVSGDDRVNASEIASAVSVLGSTTDAEEGREISLNIGGKTATAQVAADGSFTTDVDLSNLSTDGTYTLSADVSDAAGNAADQFSGSVIVDTVKPSIDSVVVSGDDRVNASEIASAVSVLGSTTDAEEGREISLNIGGKTATALVAADGSFIADIDLSGLSPDATYQVTADVADSAGNAADQFSGSVIVDTTIPSIIDVVVAGDDKVNASEIASAVSVSGSTTDAEEGREVSLAIGGVPATALVAADGSFAVDVDLSGLSADGTYTLNADVSDAAGNAAPQFSGSVLIDTTKPVINSVVLSGDDVINSSDTLASVAVSVSTSGIEDGQKLSLSVGGVTAEVAIANNVFDGTVDLSDLSDGSEISVSGDVSDIAGNAAETFTKSIVKDTATPSITIDSVATDGTINASEVGEVEIIGTASEDGQSVFLALSDGANTVEADTTVSNNSYSATVDLTGLDDSASISLDVTVADTAGNEASASKTDIIKDTLAPSIVSISVAGDNVVNSSEKSDSVAVAGSTSGVEDDQQITLTINGANITTAVSGNSFSTSADLSGLGDGTYTVGGNVADAAGNPADESVDFVIDTTPPTQAVDPASIQLSTDSGTDSTDFITNQATQSISAELDAVLSTGYVLYASVDGGATWSKIYTDENLSTTSISWDTTLLEGTNTIQFQVADSADNNGTIIKKDYTLDTTAPTQSVSGISFSVDSGTAGDLVTDTASQSITATLSAELETGDLLFGAVSLDGEGDPDWTDITDNVSGQAISWDTTLSAGENYIQFIVEDAAGNSSEPAKQSYFFDNEAPKTNTAGTTASTGEASVANLDAGDSTDNYGIASYEWTQVQSDGSALSADDIKLNIANANDATTTVITPGITDDDIDSLSFYFSLKITDVAGNSSGATATLNVSNTYTTPDITASASAPNFDQLSLSWPTTTGLTYNLHRSIASDCDLSATENCADYELYAALDLSGGAQTDSGLDFFSSYYYWLEAKYDGTVVSLSSTPLEANTTGPALNDTGITSGGDYPSGFDSHNGSSTVCDGGYLDSDNANAFVAFTAEDCELGRDADDTLNNDSDGNAGFSFTRLNSDGSEYSGSGDYGTDPWACVLDNVTGLIWEVKTNDNTLRDRDEGFTWHDPDNETFTGTESNQDTDDFIAYINTSAEVNSGSGLCGRTDWRLPTVQEIHGLADYAATSTPFIDTGYFPNTQNNLAYWAADLNVNPNLSDYAWAYDPFHDQVFTRSTTQQFTYARLVSSSEAVKSNFSDYSNNRYTDHGDGTISDTKTGLMWMQCTYGQNYDSAASSICGATTAAIDGDWRDSFTNAVLANAASSFGYTDWRLPNIKELGSLVDFSKYEPAAINTAIFAIPSNDPNDTNLYYWSSTPTNNKDDQELLTQALVIGFGTNQGGRYAGSARQTSLTGYLRLVRDDANTPRILTVNINGDNIINAGDSSNLDAIQVSGSTADVEAGKILSLAINTNAYSTSAEIKEDGSFTATIDLSGIADGTYSVTADVSDSAGEEANQFTSTLLVDTAAPTIASVSATSGTYGIGASVPLSITATDAETGLTLTSKSFNGQSLGVVTDNQDGTYTTSYTVVENDADIADGGSVITDLAFTDLAGNLGTATTSVILSGASIDAHRPTIASVSVEAGTHGIGDSVAITITAGANESGLTLTSATFNGATLGEVTDNGGGTYTATYLVEEDNAHVADGDNVEVNLAFTDPAGNVGTPTTSINLTGASIDTTPPTQNISDIDISDDSGVSDTDFLTNKPTQTITATLSDALGNGDSLHGSVDSGSTWNEIAASVSGTAITWNSVTLSSGAIQFKVVDAAGNDGAVAGQPYTLDQTNPTASANDVSANEASAASLDSSGSSDSNGIASYAWAQVESDGTDLQDNSSALSIIDADSAQASVIAPGIADDAGADQSLYFAVTITDNAGNIATSSPLTLTVSNTYTTPDITASIGTAPNFDQLSLSWPTATGLTYDLHRSSAADCDLSATDNCAGYQLYAALDLSGGAQTDSGLDFFSSYYYWLEAKYDGTVVSLSSTPTEANTTGPALNDTGVAQGGDYPSGFDSLGDGTACNGGYLVDDNGDVIADPDNHSGNSTFVPFAAEDCELGRDADATLNDDSDGNAGFSLTRLNSDGSEYSGSGDYGEEPWACVLDNITGLIWEVKTNDNTLRDRDEGFTWYNSSTADGTPSDQDTGDFVDYVNGNAEVNSGNGLCGQTNWRLPTVQELVGISDFSTYEPVVDTSYFPNSRTGAYEWSWTADLNSDTENLPNFAWLYNYYIGSIRSGGNGLGATSNSFYVRLVSSSEAVKSYFNDYSSDGGRYTDHEDGTVSDNRTGLMWMKCIYGQAHNLSDNSCGGTGAGAGGTWQEAFAKAAAINEGVGTFGYTDWRLPNMKELLSLVDLSSFQPPINQAIFPNTDGQSQWTSTLSAQDGGDAALAVGLGADPEFGLLGKTTTTTRVRLVRDDVNTPRILTLEINGDNVINSEDDLANIPVSGTTADIEDDQKITLVVGSEIFYIDVSADGFSTNIDLSTISDGIDIAITADASDSAGRAANQFTSTLLKDTTPPSIDLVVAADNIINSTEASSATITGTTEGVEDGQTISIAINDNADPVVKITSTATVTDNAFNITNLNLSGLADDTGLSLTADVADAAGNPATLTFNEVTKDTAAPTITIDSVATDGIINASEQSSVVINGSISGAANGQTVSLALSDGTNTVDTSTAVSNDSYSATVDLASFAESTSISLGVAVSDAAGNEGSASKTDIVKDTLKPSIVSISVTDDNVVNSSEILSPVAVSGSTSGVEDNQVITLTINGANITTTVSSNSFSTSADLFGLGEGSHNLTANVSDAAGNPADEATSSFNVDTTAPTQEVDPDSIQLSTDSGSSPSDLITNQATQTIGATLSANLGTGDVLYASVDGGATWQQVDSSSIEDTTISWATNLAEGTNTIQFQVADAADNNGTIVKKDYTLDTTTPGQSISTIKLSDDSGALNDDFLTNNPTQTISATLSDALVNGDSLHGSVDSGSTWDDITTSVSGTAITWTGVTLSTGAIQFKVVDAAGNDGTVATKVYTLDQTVPTIDTSGTDSTVDEGSSATLNASGSDSSGIASYAWVQVESDGSTLTGTALTIDDATAASTSVSTPGIADDGIADQSLYFAVTVTDAAGNPATSSPLTIVVDNSYTTPTISASAVGAPDFNQISLSWDANSSLTYSLYRSTDSNCDLTNYTTCTNPALYTDSTGITSNDTSASVADTDSSDSFQLFNSYYYWLGGQIGDEVVFLNSTPTIQATNSGPALNDTGITGGGDYPSGFDNHNGLADGVEGAVCNGGYFTDQGAVVSDLSSYSDTSALTFNPFTDEDCELGRDANATLNDDSDGNAAFVFTKLDISGNVLEASATDWTCVLDHTTGLIWEVKTTDGTWRDRNKAFTWYNPNHGQDYDKDGNTITFDGTESSQDTQDFIAYVNSDPSVNSGSGLCGRSNWRLPTVHEIEGLADYDAVVAVVADDGSTSYSTPTIDTDYFPYALASQYQWYWTSHLNVDPDVNTGGGSSTSNYFAWTYGSAESRTRSGTGSTVGTTDRYNFVRLVSSSTAVASHFSDYSNDRYTDNGDGTISDHQTGLMWSKCSYGQTYDANDANSDGIICEGSPAFGTWQQAFAWAADSTDHGHSDWRLPNIKELGSIVDFGSAKPAINQNIFPNTASGPYWTSTPSRANVHQTIFIGFQAGDYGPSDRISNLYLRLVRDPNLD